MNKEISKHLYHFIDIRSAAAYITKAKIHPHVHAHTYIISKQKHTLSDEIIEFYNNIIVAMSPQPKYIIDVLLLIQYFGIG